MVKSFLDANKIPYKEFDVAADKAARQEMAGKTGKMVVPVTDIDGEILIGFDEAALKHKLGLK